MKYAATVVHCVELCSKYGGGVGPLVLSSLLFSLQFHPPRVLLWVSPNLAVTTSVSCCFEAVTELTFTLTQHLIGQSHMRICLFCPQCLLGAIRKTMKDCIGIDLISFMFAVNGRRRV